ncbi:hypothetical protein ACOSQ3_024067 [Xanthoceras sorbifolium]
MINSSSPEKEGGVSTNGLLLYGGEDQRPYKKVVRYKECLKNHAAAIGGNATDGCGEFMPCGEEGTIEALKCSACNCHRNFHRREFECDHSPFECNHQHHHSPPLLLNNINNGISRSTLTLSHAHHHLVGSSSLQGGCYLVSPSTELPPPDHQVLLSYKSGSARSESDDKDDGDHGVVERPTEKIRKRFRTKFTQEQKEKMFNFAEKSDWRIQKLEESEVLQFCQEIGIKRRVLKVWMHNNKHSLAKKHSSDT